MEAIAFSPSDFVAVLNQTLEYAYPSVTIVGELANLRVSKSKWVYFDLKDEYATVKFFGTVYQLPGPLENGLMLHVQGTPRLHPQYGFNVNIVSMRAVGEGSIKRAAALLEAKLAAEGLFDESRKRPLLFPPRRIGLITSGESAAYADFMKILNERWGGVEVRLLDVQVQGEQASGQIISAIEYFNSHAEPVEVLIIIRGGGSADDLATFSTEQVTRAVASSRIPTLVAIGHEIDTSLAELAADKRASTPSNAAQLLVPDKKETFQRLQSIRQEIARLSDDKIIMARRTYADYYDEMNEIMKRFIESQTNTLGHSKRLLQVMDPKLALRRGYAILRQNGKLVRSGGQLKSVDLLDIELHDSHVAADVKSVKLKVDS